MKEYIERGALMNDLSQSVVFSCRTEDAPKLRRDINKIMTCIKRQPAADVVEVVRCKDCKHFISRICQHDFAMNLCRADDYCSYGERKDEK